MASNPYIKFYTGDYLKDTQHLSLAEHGAYMLLLMFQWNNGPLPADDDRLARILRIRKDAWRRIAPTVLAFFTPTDDGRLVQRRLEKERVSMEEIRRKKAVAGGHGGRAKSLNGKEARVASATILPEQTPSERLPVIVTVKDSTPPKPPKAARRARRGIPAVPGRERQAALLSPEPARRARDPLAKEDVLPPGPPPVPEGHIRGWPDDEVVPAEVGPYRVQGLMNECMDILDMGPMKWKYFRSMLVRVVRAGADRDRHIFPVMHDARRQLDRGLIVHSANFFESKIRELMPPDAGGARRAAA